ncbi:MAG TPA: MFS transporter [Gammaproteobacteria bacterium]|nr:MFS transporter [Gammaproteobacteria bacterium]
MSRVSLGVFQTAIMNDLHIHSAQFALLSSTAYALTTGLLQIPVGIFFGRFSFRSILLITTAIGIVGNVALMMATDFQSMLIFRVFSASGAAFGYLSSILSVLILFPRKNHGIFIGLTNFITCISASFIAGPLAQFFAYCQIAWHNIFLIFAIMNAVIFLCALHFPNFKASRKSEKSNGNTSNHNNTTLIRDILIASTCIMFLVEYLSENHGHLLLMSKNINEVTAAYILSLMWMGYAFCGPVAGYLIDKNYDFYKLLLFFSLGFFISLLALIYNQGAVQYNTIWVALFGIFSGGQGMVYPMASKLVRSQYRAVLLGAIGAFYHISVALFSPLLSYWIDGFSLTPSLFDYQHALIPLLPVAAIPFFIAFFNQKKQIKRLFMHAFFRLKLIQPSTESS